MTSSLPAAYHAEEKGFKLPETPFEVMGDEHLCIKAEGFVYKGKLEIPKSAQRPSTAGFVVDCGRHCILGDRALKRGDRVLYSQFAGYLFNFKGASGMRVMGNSEVLGILKPEVELDEDE